jgi:hypothetical protein
MGRRVVDRQVRPARPEHLAARYEPGTAGPWAVTTAVKGARTVVIADHGHGDDEGGPEQHDHDVLQYVPHLAPTRAASAMGRAFQSARAATRAGRTSWSRRSATGRCNRCPDRRVPSGRDHSAGDPGGRALTRHPHEPGGCHPRSRGCPPARAGRAAARPADGRRHRLGRMARGPGAVRAVICPTYPTRARTCRGGARGAPPAQRPRRGGPGVRRGRWRCHTRPLQSLP